jgi:hypothetical protein
MFQCVTFRIQSFRQQRKILIDITIYIYIYLYIIQIYTENGFNDVLA